MSYYKDVKLYEKFLCGAFYLGLVVPYVSYLPIIWLVVNLIRGEHLRDFVKYHCYQAMLFNLILSFLPSFFNLLTGIVENILKLLVVFDGTISLLNYIQHHIMIGYGYFIIILSLYAVIWTLRGKFTYIPPISQAVNLLLR